MGRLQVEVDEVLEILISPQGNRPTYQVVVVLLGNLLEDCSKGLA
jgi:hypothetical protein